MDYTWANFMFVFLEGYVCGILTLIGVTYTINYLAKFKNKE